MTALPLDLLRELQSASSTKAWQTLFAFAWETCSPSIIRSGIGRELSRRDAAIAPADLFLATGGWDLWTTYYDSVKRTAHRLSGWWKSTPPGRAVLILDSLSLREVPWLLSGATERGYTIHWAGPSGAELPPSTDPFAHAMRFGRRAALENNGATGHLLCGARTDSVDLPWRECVDLLDTSPDWVLWHHWPDQRIHDLGIPGRGLPTLAQETAHQLSNEDFWALIERLTTGRRLVITGDHGYAAPGLFPDTRNQSQTDHLKSRYRSGRSVPGELTPGDWVPPIDLVLTTPSGSHTFVLGRRKWRSQGGYPTLTHGGLTLLEVAVPFIEMSRPSRN